VGICPCHKRPRGYITVFVTGHNASSDGRLECSVGAVGMASCGHPTVALSGSTSTKNGGLANHRVGDVGVNCGPYVAVSGSPSNTVN